MHAALGKKMTRPPVAFAAPTGLGGYLVGVRWVSDQIKSTRQGQRGRVVRCPMAGRAGSAPMGSVTSR